MDVAVAAYVFPSMLPVAAATVVCVIVVALLLSVSSPVAKGLMIVKACWLFPTYPRLPAVSWRDIAVKRLVTCLVDECFEAWVGLVRHGRPRFELLDWEDDRLHQETDNNIDDVCGGIWVLPDCLDFLALLCAIKEYLGHFNWRERASEQRILVEEYQQSDMR